MVKFNKKAKIITLSPVNIYCMNNYEMSRKEVYEKYPYIAYEILSSDNKYIKNEIRSQFNEKYEDIFVIDYFKDNKTLTQSLIISIKSMIQNIFMIE